MKPCPYCTAEIPDEAVKCKHCGEWVDGRQGSGGRDREQTVNIRWEASEAHLKLFKWHAIGGVIGLLIFLVVMLAFFVPEWTRFKQDHEPIRKDPERRQKEFLGR